MLDIMLLLLRIGLHTNKEVSPSEYDLLQGLNSTQWEEIYNFSLQHRVTAVVYDGIQYVFHSYGNLFDSLPDAKYIRRKWFSCVYQIEQKNEKQIAQLIYMNEQWRSEGYSVLLMKGQANALLYPIPKHRTPGDIDYYLYENYHNGCELSRRIGATVDEKWYKHAQIDFQGEIYENHKYFVTTRGGKKYRSLNKDLCKLLENVDYEKFLNTEINLPPVLFNAVFLTYHALAHFLSEGLRLRQIVDWAMYLQSYHSKIEWPQLYKICDHYGFTVFLNAMNSIAIHDFGVKVHNPEIVIESPYRKKILESIIDDDFIYTQNVNVWIKRFLILKNLFKYRWKYQYIYKKSIWHQMADYCIGFVFKTE